MIDRRLGQISGNIDEKDWILLELLQADARLSYAELGRRANLSPPAVVERMKRLEDAGVILGYHAEVAPRSVGLPMSVFLEVVVKRADYAAFHKGVQNLSWVLECHHVTGRGSFLVKAAVPDIEGLETFIGYLSQFGETTTTLALSEVVNRREFTRPKARIGTK